MTDRIEKRDSKSETAASRTKDEEEDYGTDVDGWAFRGGKNETNDYTASRLQAVSVAVERDSEVYNMNHPRRGVALIFNHVHFKSMSSRTGTVKDCNNLKEALANLGFDVRVHTDPTYKTIASVLEGTAAEDHSDADTLVVVAMSHGESGLLHSSDQLYPVDVLWDPFTADRCTSLAGKPKLFFIQACRGERLDKGVKIIHKTDSTPASFSIPAYADIMVAYSTYDGFYSWRNRDAGSWFIQAICAELKRNGFTRDLLTMMTFVNRRVAVEFQSYVPQNETMNATKQIPSVVSMLTRLVYFTRKNYGHFEAVSMEYNNYRQDGKTAYDGQSVPGRMKSTRV